MGLFQWFESKRLNERTEHEQSCQQRTLSASLLSACSHRFYPIHADQSVVATGSIYGDQSKNAQADAQVALT